jgi:hypothetical protein
VLDEDVDGGAAPSMVVAGVATPPTGPPSPPHATPATADSNIAATRRRARRRTSIGSRQYRARAFRPPRRHGVLQLVNDHLFKGEPVVASRAFRMGG